MKIQWNKVTWYSKAIALALFIALPFIGFCLGIQYGSTIAGLNENPLSQAVSNDQVAKNNYYQDISEWQTDTRSDGGFSISYPLDFAIDENYAITPVTDWRLNSNNEPGIKMLTITIPKTFEPQTNFDDATLTLGRSGNTAAVSDCLKPDQTEGPGLGFATTTINGISFSIFKSAGAGAGNFYDTTSYRIIHAGQCYSVEYTIHSSQIGNYPPSYDLKAFDENTLTDVLNRMVGTFKFL